MATQSKAGKSGQTSDGRSWELADVRALAKILKQNDLSEVEVESGGARIRVRRSIDGAQVPMQLSAPGQPLVVDVPSAGTATAGGGNGVSGSAEATKAEDGVLVTSPFVGTFYEAPTPGSPPFAQVGQTISRGHTLCIVEAMKLMNEIEADLDCTILEVLVKNAEPVEYGQALFRVSPS